MDTRKSILLTSLPSDSHTWNLVYLQLLLEELGYEVTSLGCCVPYSLVVEAYTRQQPDLLVVSSVNGHGAFEGKELMNYFLTKLPNRMVYAVIGGKLTTDGSASIGCVDELTEAGFLEVFQDDRPMTEFVAFLRNRLH